MADPAVPYIKIPLPESYDGRREALVIRAWLSRINQFSHFHELNDARKLNMIPSFLAGEASLWWDAREIEVTEGRVPALANWAAFETELKREFEPQDYTFEIRTKLQKLYQNKNTVQVFTTEFRKLMTLLTGVSQ